MERKVREIDGYWNPHVRYTLKDYKNFKATMGFGGDGIGKNAKEYDPETKNEKVSTFLIFEYLFIDVSKIINL